MKFSLITLYWEENGDFCSWEGHDLTLTEAKAKAALWGFKEPKRWQFWKSKPTIYTLL